MLHTSILAYANRNGILARPVASFPLLFTTSSDVLCSKFSGVWETMWIFKVARWTHERCTKINKNPTISNGIRASSFEIWTANLAQSLTMGTLTNSWSFNFGDSNWNFGKVGYPVGTQPDNWHSDADISDLGLKICIYILRFYFWVKKAVYWDHLAVTSLCTGFRSKRAAAGLGPSGLMKFGWLTKIS